MDRGTAAAFFGLDQACAGWLRELAALDPAPVRLLGRESLADAVGRVGGDADDLAELEALRPELQIPAVRWLFDRCVHQLLAGIGVVQAVHPWPKLAARSDVLNRYFYVWVFLSALPQVREFHQRRGIPEEVSRASLADLGQQLAVRRRIFGKGGLHTQQWLTIAFSGLLYRLGRLQFNLRTIDETDVSGQPVPFMAGDPALGVHIPEHGRLDPASCDESFRRAAGFFPRHFPEREHRVATCNSWLLDPQLAEYLPAESNIIHFQRRFFLTDVTAIGDEAVFEFVFRRIDPPLDRLPQRTTLERAVVAHLRGGRHWHAARGWLELG